ncbi:cell division protein FtsZ [Odoribacter sp. N15.MGS-14]|jgi:cell division protein ftsZ|uniref:cell division protein FtsZ n=1 Tax=Odoribacter sp. N15.MGS-14 TaxID=1637502 RepID=UPI0006236ADE|nr:cell division protein FtsZ [Odoribacter sp. N15.MGS-14]
MEIEDDLISLKLPDATQEESIIKVIGVGGGGSNAVNHMFRQGIHGVEFVVCNTDIQALRQSRVKNRIQLGKELTEGRGAGCQPERGRLSAIESMDFIKTILEHNTRMVFITAGMGGGTGTGAAPEIARQAKELGILTIGIVTVPFSFEGKRKIEQAMTGIDELEEYVDALLIIANERLREIYGDLKLSDAFAMADNVLTIAAKSIAEIITVKGYVNVDFADVESVMRDSGVALMGAAEAEGEGRAMEALTNALISPLLNSNDIRGASNILLNMLYGEKEVTMDEISLITDSLREKVGRNVNVIWGTGKDETLGDKLRVAVIATGFNNNRGRATAATGQKIETATTTSAKKPYFKVEPLPDDLEMKVMNPAELEEEARLRRQRQEEERARKQKRESNRRVDRFERSQRGVNEVPDTNGWLKRKIGTLFSDEE